MRLHPVLICATLLFGLGKALGADGLVLAKDDEVWPQWQARVTVSTTTLLPVTLSVDSSARSALQSGALFSDFYFDTPGLRLPSSFGGLRATGGLIVGPRGLAQGLAMPALRPVQRYGVSLQSGASPLAGDANNDTVPYLGLGYTGLALKGGWGITADLGLVAENPSRARALFGNSGQSWDNTLREMRISPVFQVGVNYAF